MEPSPRRELGLLVSVWFVLVSAMVLLAREYSSIPGLWYDEAVFGGMAKDFLTGRVHGPHMPGSYAIDVLGRPFPLFVQSYLGALKCWMLMPSFELFGYTAAVLRRSNLFWGCIALLFFMLGTWRWLGLRTAAIAGALLALDPTYFFLCILNWDVSVTSLLCRSVAFYLAVDARRSPYAFWAAFFAGLGVFNKVDFAVLLVSLTGAALVFFGPSVRTAWRTPNRAKPFAVVGFLLGVGLMLFHAPRILLDTFVGPHPSHPGEWTEKIQSLSALYDGSYFYRLINVGGVFERMFAEPVGWPPMFGAAVLVAGSLFAARAIRNRSDRSTRTGVFLFVAIALSTLGVILLPRAIRIHHAVVVYPLPQLIIALAAGALLEPSASARGHRIAVQSFVCAAGLALVLGQLLAIHRTQELIRETGGRGRWSDSLDAFSREHRHRGDLTIVSLDWGFNEQLSFLTDGPELREPFWVQGPSAPALSRDPHSLYLVHPDEFALFPSGARYLTEARALGAEVEVRPYLDRQDHAAFYTIRFR